MRSPSPLMELTKGEADKRFGPHGVGPLVSRHKGTEKAPVRRSRPGQHARFVHHGRAHVDIKHGRTLGDLFFGQVKTRRVSGVAIPQSDRPCPWG